MVRAPKGYTLTEVLMVVAIVGIISSVFPRLFIQVTRFFRQNQARADIQRDARSAFDLMSRNLRQALASSVAIDQASGQPPYSRISFTKIGGGAITYYQQGTKLYQVAGGTKTIAENLRYMAFTHLRTDDDNLVSVTLTLEKATYNQQTKALQLSVEKIRIKND
ncbi:MAG: type II secretion system protein [Elusimicrobia bacterium]|nr:type II secretion system protein [Elusimicrobiota bacterium]